MSSLYSLKDLKKIFVLIAVSSNFLVACQSFKTRDEVHKQKPNLTGRAETPHQSPSAPVMQQPAQQSSNPEQSTPPPAFENPEHMALPPVAIPEMPRIGVILSGGGAKAYAHIGFLQELGRLKIPLHSIAGIEFAAPMAALYANKELANEVEWQMFKIKDEDLNKKSLLGSNSKPQDISVLADFSKLTFSRMKVEDMKLPFACPAFNTVKNQVYLMSRGSVESLLPYCWPYPPVFKPYKANVSAIRDVKILADYLKSKGANYILFVNAMGTAQKRSYVGDSDSFENIVWTEIASQYMKSQSGVDAVLTLSTEEFAITDFSKRREIMQKGSDSASKALKNFSKKWGL